MTVQPAKMPIHDNHHSSRDAGMQRRFSRSVKFSISFVVIFIQQIYKTLDRQQSLAPYFFILRIKKQSIYDYAAIQSITA